MATELGTKYDIYTHVLHSGPVNPGHQNAHLRGV